LGKQTLNTVEPSLSSGRTAIPGKATPGSNGEAVGDVPPAVGELPGEGANEAEVAAAALEEEGGASGKAVAEGVRR